MVPSLRQFKRFLPRLAIAVLSLSLLPLSSVQAAQITGRTLTLSSSSATAGNATTSYTFTFTVPTTGTSIKSFAAQICTTASGTCTTPSGFSNSAVTISQPTGMGAVSGWTVSNATTGSLQLSNSANATNPSGNQTVTFNNVQNPTTTNTTFYARMTTYSDSSWTTSIDSGNAAASTANQITFSGSVPESLTFCVGVTVTGNCASTTGTAVSFSPSSTFSTTTTTTATSQFAAATNASSGYVVTVNGATLTSGARTIAAAGTQSANGTAVSSVSGSSQFGMNVGSISHASVNSAGAAGTNYGSSSLYRYFSGDTVATSGSNPSDFDTYTANYIVNISGFQAAGTYTTTLTFICTATF